MTELLTCRRAKLATLLKQADLDGVTFVPGPNFLYLSGLNFHLMERPTLLIAFGSGEVAGIVPELEREKWREVFPDAQVWFWQDSEGFDRAFAQAADALNIPRLGIECGRMRAFEADALRRHFGQHSVFDAEVLLRELRLAKTPEETEAIEAAIRVSEVALGETLAEVKTGMSERTILGILKMRLLANGADGFAFEPIVLAGGNSSNPHGVAGERALQAGEPLLIDFGAQLESYNADITRTFFCEYASDQHAQIYETVLAANEKGRACARAGLTAHELDETVTARLRSSPFADMVVHKTGHGLGLDVHEAPQLMAGNHAELVPGTVVTIEPGLYRSGEIGVRIEDDVVIEPGGCRSLTSFPRDLTLIGG
jgi:Xaa-Pro aminopeptidase